MDIRNAEAFVTAVKAGSLAGAARRLKLTPMSVTRRLAALEQGLGVRLMHRTTRSIALTPEGEAFLPFAVEMVDIHNAARAVLSPSITGASGLLRVTSPITLGRKRIVPLISELLEENPGLSIDLELSDAVVDIVSAGFDLAIRIAPLKDSRLIARRLVDNPKLVYAAPSYLARHGMPRTIKDLESHQCLTFSNVTHWQFVVGGQDRLVRVSSRFSSSGVDGFLGACINGLGLAQLSAWDAKDELENGNLVVVELENAAPRDLAIWAVYPTRQQVLPKLRVFVEKLQQTLV